MTGRGRDRHDGEADERGDLPVVTVLILFLVAAIMTLLTGVVSDATSTITATAAAAADAAAVELATSAADAFYGQLEAAPGDVSSIWPHLDTWTQFSPSGAVEACASAIHNNCFRLDVKVASSPSGATTSAHVGPSSPDELPQQAATLTVTANVDCRLGGTAASPTPDCATNAIVQHLRRRTFLDYLYFVDHNSLDPNVAATLGGSSVAADPAYQGSAATGDVIDGPIHTNSGPIPVCGDPTFDGVVEVSGAASGSGWTQASGTGCADSAPVFDNSAYSSLQGTGCANPTPRKGGVATGCPVLSLPTSDSSLEQIAAAGGGSLWPGQSGYAFSGNITVTINGDTLDITDPSGTAHTNVAFPVTGVIYASGDITVSGTNNSRLTLAAGGTITVSGNLDYGCAGPGVTPVPSSCPDVTGLVAQGNIWLDDTGANLTVDAAMLSLSNSADATGSGGTIPSCSSTSTCPTLTINGAMATDYRGLFGFYESTTGTLTAGWHKDFVYDTRLFNLQPPWFLSPLAGQWVRSSPVVVGAPVS